MMQSSTLEPGSRLANITDMLSYPRQQHVSTALHVARVLESCSPGRFSNMPPTNIKKCKNHACICECISTPKFVCLC